MNEWKWTRMTQKEAQDTNMTQNEIEEERKSICLKSAKNEHEYSNNNQANHCKLNDFNESKNNQNPIKEVVHYGESNVGEANGAINNNSDIDTLKKDELKSTIASGIKFIKMDIYIYIYIIRKRRYVLFV